MELEVAVFVAEPSRYLLVPEQARRMRRLGMSLRSIGGSLGVDEKTVRRALDS
ncbi:MAG: hypothetical protein RIF41_35805 [Polyangiaceae bacterium]